MQPVTSPGDRAGICRSPETQCIGVEVQTPDPIQQGRFPPSPSAAAMVAWWVMGLAEPCLCLAQHRGHGRGEGFAM